MTVNDNTTATATGPDPAARFAYLSYLRVLAITAVVGTHVSGLTVKLAAPEGSAPWWTAVALLNATTWAVPVFVMISGALLLGPSREGAGEFYRRRLRRIAIPLVVWHLFYIAFSWLVLGRDLSLPRIVLGLVKAQTYTALYFFWLILGLYLLTPLLRGFLAQASRRDQWWMTAVITAGCLAYKPLQYTLGYFGQGNAEALNALTYCVPYLGFYLLGYLLRDVVLPRRWLPVAALGVLAVLAECSWQYAHLKQYPLLGAVLPVNTLGLLPAASAVLVFLLARGLLPPTSRWARPPHAARWRYLGDLTLGVFVLHLAVLRGLQELPGWERGAGTVGGLFLLLSSTVLLSFGLSALLRLVKPLRRAL